jgi:hypothetical protein
MLVTFMETHTKEPAPLAGKVTVSLIHHGACHATYRHKVLISGNQQGLRSLAQLLRRLAESEG